ncbi:lysozyme-like [Centruroides sculpturatus]|uniref:lysozyme-like n=1 Tax=Centruroides sculpturatus TaxID=218467 RepID=UPI000C6EFE0D|nr:lysozyme-like [Centruroides sculpturatus]
MKSFLYVFTLCYFCCCQAKIYERCQLARELMYRFGFNRSVLGHWMCIIKHGSGYNTSSVIGPYPDGSYDHGLFSINDRCWCSPPDDSVLCQVRCEDLRTDDITKAVKCARFMFSFRSFNMWETWLNNCRNKDVDVYIRDCNLRRPRN